MRRLRYAVPHDRVDEVLAALAARLAGSTGRQTRRDEFYFDTFDDRLCRDGAALALINPRGRRPLFELADLEDGAPRLRAPLTVKAARQPPAFAGELPALLREEIGELLGNRRLLPKVALRHQTTLLRLGPVRGGLRLELAQPFLLEAGDGPKVELPADLSFPAGGERADALRELLDGLGLAGAEDEHRALAAARLLGSPFGGYSSKLELELEPVESGAAAARKIHLALLQTMERNEDGVIRDLDAEFLHDFRVAIRRARAALGQIRDVFPAEATEACRRELGWLGEATGPQRDLDVHLELLPGAAVALAGQDGAAAEVEAARSLAPLELLLRARQQEAHAALTGTLASDRYRQWKTWWRRFLEAPSAAETSALAAEEEILTLVAGRLRRLFRRLRRHGKKVDESSPAADLHRLRIDGKKLRYLLEFCRSLFPADELDPVLRRLKLLQDHLGELNDLEVQKGALAGFAGDLAKESCEVATLLALGRLIEQASSRQRELREQAAEAFTEMRGDPARRFFRRLKGAAAGS